MQLHRLCGSWEGEGRGDFPTIEAFRYRESLRFTTHGPEPDLHYEQRTWLVSDGDDDGDPSHWESGFLLPREDGSVDLLNSQQSGRVEVLTGQLSSLEGDGFELRLESIVHAHDPRMISTARVIRLIDGELSYECFMATDRVGEPHRHLECRLRRQS